MMILHLFVSLVLLAFTFITGKYLFWLLFMKDAPSADEQDALFYRYSRE